MISHIIPCRHDVTGRFGSSVFSSVVSHCGNTASCSSFSNSHTDIDVENGYSMVSLSVDVTWWWHCPVCKAFFRFFFSKAVREKAWDRSLGSGY